MPDMTDSEAKEAREKQAAAERQAISQDAGAVGNIEVAARNAGIDPADVAGTWQNQQREIKRFNDAERAAVSRDAGAVGNIEVAARNAGIAPEDAPGTWQHQQREIKRFNDAEAEARRRDPGAMGRTDAAQLEDQRQARAAAPVRNAPPAQRTSPNARSTASAGAATAGQSSALQRPTKGFTLAELSWIEKLIVVIQTNKGIAGRNVSIDNRNGQVINSSDCGPCA